MNDKQIEFEMKTKKIIFAMLLLISLGSYGQQDAQYTQYMYNTMNVNPAYAGSRGVMSIFGLYRTQWVGLDGAPKTGSLSIHSPLGNNVGGGLSLMSDKLGPTQESIVSVDFSYTIQTSYLYKLSFGVKGSANFFNLDTNKLSAKDSNDPTLQNFHNSFSPNIGAGVYFHSDQLYLGLSAPNLLEMNRYNDNDVVVNKERMNLYLIGGYVFDLSPSVKFKPAFMLKGVSGAPLQLDVSGNFMFNEKFVLGAAWRWGAAASAMAGFQVSEGMYIGYGYDLETTKLNNYNSGSHEIFLRFEFANKENRIVSPRFF